MKKFSLILTVIWATVMVFIIFNAVTNLKQLEAEKNYLEDNAVIYNE